MDWWMQRWTDHEAAKASAPGAIICKGTFSGAERSASHVFRRLKKFLICVFYYPSPSSVIKSPCIASIHLRTCLSLDRSKDEACISPLLSNQSLPLWRIDFLPWKCCSVERFSPWDRRPPFTLRLGLVAQADPGEMFTHLFWGHRCLQAEEAG